MFTQKDKILLMIIFIILGFFTFEDNIYRKKLFYLTPNEIKESTVEANKNTESAIKKLVMYYAFSKKDKDKACSWANKLQKSERPLICQ